MLIGALTTANSSQYQQSKHMFVPKLTLFYYFSLHDNPASSMPLLPDVNWQLCFLEAICIFANLVYHYKSNSIIAGHQLDTVNLANQCCNLIGHDCAQWVLTHVLAPTTVSWAAWTSHPPTHSFIIMLGLKSQYQLLRYLLLCFQVIGKYVVMELLRVLNSVIVVMIMQLYVIHEIVAVQQIVP